MARAFAIGILALAAFCATACRAEPQPTRAELALTATVRAEVETTHPGYGLPALDAMTDKVLDVLRRACALLDEGADAQRALTETRNAMFSEASKGLVERMLPEAVKRICPAHAPI